MSMHHSPATIEAGGDVAASLATPDAIGDVLHDLGKSSRNFQRLVRRARTFRSDLERLRESFEASGLLDFQDYLAHLADESGRSSRDVLLMSLGLFSLALKAERAGQKVAILDADDAILREIGGFGLDSPPDDESSTP